MPIAFARATGLKPADSMLVMILVSSGFRTAYNVATVRTTTLLNIWAMQMLLRTAKKAKRHFRILRSEQLEVRRVLDSTVVFNEIMYNDAGTDDEKEWIELHNQMSVNIDMSGWSLQGAVTYDFPQGTVLDSGDYLVIAENPTMIMERTGLSRVAGPFAGNLSNSGEVIQLRNHTGRLMNELDYNDRGKWPIGPDGSGATLAKLDPQASTEDPSNWRASEQTGGTPGAMNFLPTNAVDRQVVFPIDTEWKFDQSGNDLGEAWRDPNFDDSSWDFGPALFARETGALDGPKNTPLETGQAVTYYFRKTFEFDGNVDGDATIRLRHLIDDAAVFYLNGQPFDWFHIPEDEPLNFETRSDTNVGNADVVFGTPIEASLLKRGTNTLAVEVHQYTPTSNDVVFGAELLIDRPIPKPNPNPADLAFNEVSAADDESFWIEISNTGDQPFDLTGFVLESSAGNQVTLEGLTIEPNGLLAIEREQITFGSIAGEKVFLFSPEKSGLIDALIVAETAQARASKLDGIWQTPSDQTKGQPNQFEFPDEIVINEILYHARPTYSQSPEYSLTSFLTTNATWKYDQSGSDLGTSWRNPEFDDTAWPSGQGLFFDETSSLPAEKNTPIEVGQSTYYFRTTFEITDDPAELDMVMRHIVDDGAVFYLNGTEFHRFNIEDDVVTFETEAASAVSNAKSVGPVKVPSDLLAVGTNFLAVEVHQSSRTSNDVVFGLSLDLQSQTKDGIEFQASDEEWVEIYNRSDHVVDMTGWRFENAIDFTFPEGTTLAAGEYAIVAKDSAALAARHSGIRIIGEYSKTLGNDNDRIELKDSVGNIADEVEYFDGGYWPEFADAGGVSLELLDPFADNSQAMAWTASDESSRTEWNHYTYTKTVEPVVHDPPINFHEMVMGLLSGGVVLMDNISVIEEPTGAAIELIQNGSFEADTLLEDADKWRIVGTHQASHVVPDPLNANNQVLRLNSEGRSSYLSNHAETTLANGAQVEDGKTYQISFDAMWVAGSPQLRTELYYKDAAKTTILDQPDKTGTPGMKNSVVVDNLGPVISDLSHSPVIPTSRDEITIRATAVDNHGIAEMTLMYVEDETDMPFQEVAMTNDGAGNFSAVIPAHEDQSLIQFYIRSTDQNGATSVFPPAGADSRALFKVNDQFVPDQLRHDLQILMTDADTDNLHRALNMMDNHRYGSTVIYNGTEVFYDTGTRLRGSMFTRQNQDATGYNVEFPADHLFRGIHDSIALDQNGEREILVKFMTTQSGNVGGTYDDVLQLTTPSGVGGGPTLAYISRQGEMFQRESFENGDDGTLFKFEGIRVLTSTSDSRDPESLKLYQPIGWVPTFDIEDLGNDKELYRWPFFINRNRAQDDYDPLIRMAQAFSLNGSQLQEAVSQILDMDNWTQTFALMSLMGIGDAYSQGNPHNLNMFVRPEDGKIVAMPWDWDFVFSQPVAAPLHGDKNIGKILDLPPYERLLMGHMDHMIDTVFNAEYMAPWLVHYSELIEDNMASLTTIVQSRTDVVRSEFPDEVPFYSDANPPLITVETLVSGTSGASILVPTQENGGDQIAQQDWIQSEFIPSEIWRDGAAAIGYEPTPDEFQDSIEFDIADMQNANSSVYVRVPFTLNADPASFDRFVLQMKYDDGFIAYLNGQQVAEANSPSSPAWDSRATRTHGNADAIEFVKFNLTDHIDLLNQGENVLAIHGLNRSVTNNDALFAPELALEKIESQPIPEITVNGTDAKFTGRAWIDVREIRIQGESEPLELNWTTTTNWEMTLPLVPGRQEVVLEAYNYQGELISATQINVTDVDISGDLNADGQTNVDDITRLCSAIRDGEMNFDLNLDQVVNLGDLEFMVTQVFDTNIGDSNLDGVFDTSDLLTTQYDDSVDANSTWANGDWNCDREFNSSDLVAAFQVDTFVRQAVGSIELDVIAAAAISDDDLLDQKRKANGKFRSPWGKV